MLIERPATATPKATPRKIPKGVWIAALVVLGAILAGVVILATHWPFTRQNVQTALEEASGRPVRIGTFSTSYFPPGCTAGGIRFLHRTHAEAPPLITVERLEIQGSFTGMFTSPKRLAAVRVVGMHMQIPPKDPNGQGRNPVPLNAGAGGKSLAISKITADGAVLEFPRRDGHQEPYRLKIDQLGITEVGSGNPMKYRATLTNSEPPGLIRSEGTFGPWNPQDVGATPVSGAYTYDGIDLGRFRGLSGKGNAKGQFSGPLSRIRTAGSVEFAGFEVDHTGHPVRLATTFDATVNGTNGDVFLNPAVARFRRTEIEVRGWIAGHREESGKTVGLDVQVPRGRVEDLLYLFSKAAPGMSGNVALGGKFTWPPGPRKFLEKIRMDLVFGLQASRFTKPGTQDSINRISESAQGESKKEEDEDARTVFSRIRGRVSLLNGTAHIGKTAFSVPGADATIQGTYRLTGQQLDLHGVLDTKGHLSDTTSGFKALVLKAVTPLFKKKNSVREVPFRITGEHGTTKVAIDWKRNLAK